MPFFSEAPRMFRTRMCSGSHVTFTPAQAIAIPKRLITCQRGRPTAAISWAQRTEDLELSQTTREVLLNGLAAHHAGLMPAHRAPRNEPAERAAPVCARCGRCERWVKQADQATHGLESGRNKMFCALCLGHLGYLRPPLASWLVRIGRLQLLSPNILRASWPYVQSFGGSLTGGCVKQD